MKKILNLILFVSLVFSVSVSASSITVLVDGEMLETPIVPQMVNNRTMLPMRAIFESLGAKVEWMEEDRIIFATKGETLITLKIGFDKMSVQKISSDENLAVVLEVAPFITNNHTLVPARAVSEAFNAKVDWIRETRTVIIKTADEEK